MSRTNETLKAALYHYDTGIENEKDDLQVTECFQLLPDHLLADDTELERSSNEAGARAIASVSLLQKNKVRRKITFSMLKYAALLLLVSGIAFFMLKPTAELPEKYLEIVTLAGEKKTISLSDGSKVFLNSSSRLSYPQKFSSKTRVLRLSGEGFFQVAHQEERPFIVHTKEMDIQVLGTSFNINNYAEAKEARVAVATGKVSVSNPAGTASKSFMLMPGDGLHLNKNTHRFAVYTVPATEVADWQQNRLDFKFERLDKIVPVLERMYGVKISVKDKQLGAKRLKLKVKKETLANVLKILSISGDHFPYQINGRQVTIGQ